jgi:alkanesulfonate monooxygenase SsuD/methylene tetrahydromethanopterin reductase-like flavin-dependent oxidoreductase (luciferase family)
MVKPRTSALLGSIGMEFGTFYQLPCAPEQSPLQRYEETLIQIQHADSLGLDIAWLAELHFFPTFSIMPSPLLVASAVAQRTRRIRLGIAVNLLPLHQPLRNAEDAATLDILSNGRLEYGAGRGSIPLHFAGYNIPLAESRERFLEALDVLMLAWTTERFSYDGKYYSIKTYAWCPSPYKSPFHPCAWHVIARNRFRWQENEAGGFSRRRWWCR